MRELKILTALVYFGVAGVGISFGGGIFAAVRQHQEETRPHPSVFPTPAALAPAPGDAAAYTAPATPGGLPTPAH